MSLDAREADICADRDHVARRDRTGPPDIDGTQLGDIFPRHRGTIGQRRRFIARPSCRRRPAYLEPIMQSHLPAGDSRSVVFATTAGGLRLPVIDVTHPAFAVPDDPASLATRRDAFLTWDRRNRRVPRIVTRLLMRLGARRSPLLRKMLASDNGYLDSISTYMLKLGVDHLPPGFDGPVDRKVAAAPHVGLIRLRMQQIARLLAEALLAPLADAPDAPLHLVNIAGGPALDSINALIMLARTHATLIHRPIAIHVFDAQPDGPTFGARALLALTSPGEPLHGLEVQFQHHAYDWNDTAPLAHLLADLAARGAVGGRPVRVRYRRCGRRQPNRAGAGRRADRRRLGHELERGTQADDRADETPAFCARPGRLRAARRTERL
jgi:hypothetical protein